MAKRIYLIQALTGWSRWRLRQWSPIWTRADDDGTHADMQGSRPFAEVIANVQHGRAESIADIDLGPRASAERATSSSTLAQKSH
jgi:hypothetical protein